MNTKTANEGIEPALFELGDDEVLETLEDFEANEPTPKAAAVHEPTPAPKRVELVKEKAKVELSEQAVKPAVQHVQFDTQDVLAGAMMTRNPNAVAVDVEEEEDLEPSDAKPGVATMLMKNIKFVIGGVALMAISFIFLPSSKTAAPVAQPVASAPTQAPVVAPSPTLQFAEPAAAAVDNPALDIASMGASPDEQSRLSAELDKDLQKVPPAEQTCSNPTLTSYEQRQCSRYTAQMFFKCTEGGGRRWNVEVQGCEQI